MYPAVVFDILTIFPNLLSSPLEEGLISKAIEKSQIQVNLINIRDFALDKHRMTDDRPFGGGAGMVMKPEPLAAATNDVLQKRGEGTVILLSPQGRLLDQSLVKKLSKIKHLVLVCGRYEGVDARFITRYVDEEISIGDYILTGGELAAMIMVDSITRMIPGVLGSAESAETDSFSRNLLKHMQYTRPRDFEDMAVPEVLLSGNHRKIEDMRLIESVERTLRRRPDLIKNAGFSKSEVKILKKHGIWQQVKAACQGQDNECCP